MNPDHPYSWLSVVSFQREKCKNVRITTPIPSSVSLDENNSSAKVEKTDT